MTEPEAKHLQGLLDRQEESDELRELALKHLPDLLAAWYELLNVKKQIIAGILGNKK